MLYFPVRFQQCRSVQWHSFLETPIPSVPQICTGEIDEIVGAVIGH
jgi:hypothetical protein